MAHGQACHKIYNISSYHNFPHTFWFLRAIFYLIWILILCLTLFFFKIIYLEFDNFRLPITVHTGIPTVINLFVMRVANLTVSQLLLISVCYKGGQPDCLQRLLISVCYEGDQPDCLPTVINLCLL